MAARFSSCITSSSGASYSSMTITTWFPVCLYALVITFFQTLPRSAVLHIDSIIIAVGLYNIEQFFAHFYFGVFVFCGSYVKMYHGISFPLFLQLHDFRTFEEMTLATEVRYYCRRKQWFAESPGAAEKNVFCRIFEFSNQICFVNINISSLSDFRKSLHPYRVFIMVGFHD